MIGNYARAHGQRLAAAGGLLILLAHVLLTAFAPAEMLLLSPHDHLLTGKVTIEDWIAHQRAHLQLAGHHFTQSADAADARAPASAQATRGKIVSLTVSACDVDSRLSIFGATPTCLAAQSPRPEPTASTDIPILGRPSARPGWQAIPLPPPR